MICKCGNEKCHGSLLLHPKEMSELEQKKEKLKATYGDVSFELKVSKNSGEIFTTFYELHVIANETKEVVQV